VKNKAIGFLKFSMLAVALSSVITSTQAKEFPTKPVQMIVPYAPGGSTDLAGRIIAKAMTERLGQAVVVENRAGAAGTIGVSQVLRAFPDGYTSALSGVSTTLLHELLGRKLPYSGDKDINPVAYLGSSGMAIITRKESPINTVKDIIEKSKKAPASISVATAGNASPAHLATEYLSKLADIELTHIPYNGDSAVLGDLATGRVDIAVVGIASVAAQITGGTLKAIAITSAKRLSSLPDVPVVAESGLAGYEADIWNLLVLPKGTPQEVDQKLNSTVNTLMQQKDVQEQLLKLGMISKPMTLAEIKDFVSSERKKWQKVIADAKIKID
jgi:tripartite-type tricarboxylate transporter receptor subunit TctC